MGIEQLQLQGPDDIGQGPVYIRRSDAEEALLKKLREECVDWLNRIRGTSCRTLCRILRLPFLTQR